MKFKVCVIIIKESSTVRSQIPHKLKLKNRHLRRLEMPLD